MNSPNIRQRILINRPVGESSNSEHYDALVRAFNRASQGLVGGAYMMCGALGSGQLVSCRVALLYRRIHPHLWSEAARDHG